MERTALSFEPLEQRQMMIATPVSFDFATDTSTVDPGALRVTHNTLYTGALGYGWNTSAATGSFSVGDQDGVYGNVAKLFQVTTPAAGRYEVSITAGSPNSAISDMQLTVYGTAGAAINLAAGAVATQTFIADLSANTLSINVDDLGASADYWAIQSISVRSTAKLAPGTTSPFSYTENAAPTLLTIFSSAAVTDPEAGDFNGGVLQAQFTAGSQATDVLSIPNQGTGANQIGVSGNQVSFSGTTIGTFNGGSNGVPLAISLNANATLTAVNYLFKRIGFSSTSDNPTASTRTVEFRLTKSNGAVSNLATSAITVTPVNDAPTVSGVTSAAYSIGGWGTYVAPAGVVVDPDHPTGFSGGKLDIGISSGGNVNDSLFIVNQGTNPGQVGVSGSNVSVGGVVVGTFTGGGSDLANSLKITFNASATLDQVNAVYRAVAFKNSVANPPTTTRVLRTIATDPANAASTAVNHNVVVSTSGQAPVISGVASTTASYIENLTSMRPFLNAVVTDSDTPILAYGTVAASIATNSHADDRLEIIHQGSGAGQIGVVPNSGGLTGTVSYEGTPIGTYTISGSGNTLTVSLNAVASLSAVNALVIQVGFRNIGDNPGTALRTVAVNVSDGTGLTSSSASRTIQVTAINDPPVIAGISSTLTYVENAPASVIASSADLTDADNPSLSGGSVAVTIAQGAQVDDRIEIVHQGIGAGQIGLNWSQPNVTGNVSYGGVVFGSVSGTNGGQTFSVSLNSSATPAAVSAFLKQLTFRNLGDNPGSANRLLSFTITDPVGDSATATKTVAVTAVNDAPTLSGFAATPIFNENGNAVSVTTTASVIDPDTSAFNNGVLSVSISANAQADDRLEIASEGNAAGQIGVNWTVSGVSGSVSYGGTTFGTLSAAATSLSITLNSSATSTMVAALIKRFTFRNLGDNPTSLSRSIVMTLSDGQGATSTPITQSITVVATNDPPAWGPFTSTLNFVENTVPFYLAASGTITDVDSLDLAGGVLSIGMSGYTDADDVFEIIAQGGGAGQVNYFNDNVLYGGVAVGVKSGGTGGQALQIQFNGAATPAAASAILKRISYRNNSDNPATTQRSLQWSFSDGDGAQIGATQAVTVTRVNDQPILTLGGTVPYYENAVPVWIASGGLVADPDTTNFAGGQLTVNIQQAATPDDFILLYPLGPVTLGAQNSDASYQVLHNGTVVGSVARYDDRYGVRVTFNAAADVTVVRDVLRSAAFRNDSDAPIEGLRTIRFVLWDGQDSSVPKEKYVYVYGINDPPVLQISGTTKAIGDDPVILAPGATLTDIDTVSFDGGHVSVIPYDGVLSGDRVFVSPNELFHLEMTSDGIVHVLYGTYPVNEYGGGTNPYEVANYALYSDYGNYIENDFSQAGFTLNLVGEGATVPVVQALIRRIAFQNSEGDDQRGVRTLQFQITESGGSEFNSISSYLQTKRVVVAKGTQEAEVIYTPQGSTSSSTIVSGDWTVDFGSSALREVVQASGQTLKRQNFNITNLGTSELHTSNLSLPNGFSLVGVFPSVIPPATSSLFTIQFDAEEFGVTTGTLSFFTDDEDENPFSFTLQGTVTGTPPSSAISNVALINDSGTSSTDKVTSYLAIQGNASFATSLTAGSQTFSQGSIVIQFSHGGPSGGTFGYAPEAEGGIRYGGHFDTELQRYVADDGALFDGGVILSAPGLFNYDPRANGLPDSFSGELNVSYRILHYFAGTGRVETGSWQTFTMTVEEPTPEISVFDSSSGYFLTGIVDGTTNFDFGTIAAASSDAVVREFVIKNDGNGILTIDPTSLSLPDGFSLQGTLPPSIAPGENASFYIRYDTWEIGEHSGEISFLSNDADENPFNFFVHGTTIVNVPEIEVTSSATGTLTSGTDNIAFGSTTLGASITREITISNEGLGLLSLDLANVTLPEGFSVSSWPAYEIVTAAHSTLVIRMDAAIAGTYSGTISIPNNDENESPFTLTLSGEVLIPPPESFVSLDAVNSAELTTTGSVDFGAVNYGDTVYHTFYVSNHGIGNLNLTAGYNDTANNVTYPLLPEGFRLVGEMPSIIAPGSFATITVAFDGLDGTPRSFSGALAFTTDDADEPNYLLSLSGGSLGWIPEIAVEDEFGQNLQSGSSTVNFGTTVFGLESFLTLTIRNENLAPLIIDASAMSIPAGFALADTAPTQVSGFASADLKLKLISAIPGNYSGNLIIPSNDEDESSYVIYLTGHVVDKPFDFVDVRLETDDGQSDTDQITTEPFIVGGVSELPYGVTSVLVQFDHVEAGNTADGNPDGSLLVDVTSRSFRYDPRTSDPAFLPSLSARNVRYREVLSDAGGNIIATGDWRDFQYTFRAKPASEIAVSDPAGNAIIGDGTDSFAFDDALQGDLTEMMLTIDNSGELPLTLTLDETVLGDFEVVGGVPEEIDPKNQASVTVRMHTDVIGLKSGTFKLTTNDPDEGTFSFALSGEAKLPTADVEVRTQSGDAYASGGTIALGTSPVGFPRSVSLNIYNRGTGTLLLDPSSVSLTGGFQLSRMASSIVAANGGMTQLSFRFYPGSAGTYNGSLTFATNDPDTPNYTVNLTADAVVSNEGGGTSGDSTYQLATNNLHWVGGTVDSGGEYSTPPSIAGTVTAAAGVVVAGLRIEIDVDGNGFADQTGTVQADGTFSVSLGDRRFNAGQVTIGARVVLTRPAPASRVTSDWESLSFTKKAEATPIPILSSFSLTTSTGTPGDLHAVAPIFNGVMQYSGTSSGKGAVQFSFETSGDEPDMTAFANSSGAFQLDARRGEHEFHVGDVVAVRARPVVYDAQSMQFVKGEWVSLTFTLDASPDDQPPVVESAGQVTDPAQRRYHARDLEIAGIFSNQSETANGVRLQYAFGETGETIDGEVPSFGENPGDFRFVVRQGDIPVGAAYLRVRAGELDAETQTYRYGEWFTIELAGLTPPAAPTISNLVLVSDTDEEDDNVTSDPRISGTLVVSEADPRSVSILVDINGDGITDGMVRTKPDGSGRFEFDPRQFGFKPGAGTIAVSASHWSEYRGVVVSTGRQTISLTYAVAAPIVPTISNLHLAIDTGEADGHASAVSTILGTVAINGAAASGILIDYDLNGDGRSDGTTTARLTDGSFAIMPTTSGLTANQTLSVGVRARIWDAASRAYVGSAWQAFSYTYEPADASAGHVSNPRLVNDTEEADGATTDPRVTGFATSADYRTDGVAVEYDWDGDSLADGFVNTTFDGTGAFIVDLNGILPQTNAVRAVTLQMRVKPATPPTDPTSGWTLFSFSYLVTHNPNVIPTITSPELADGTHVDGVDVTSDPRIHGNVSLPDNAQRIYVVQYDLTGDGQPEGLVFTDADGNYEIDLSNRLHVSSTVNVQVRAGLLQPETGFIAYGDWSAYHFNYVAPMGTPVQIGTGSGGGTSGGVGGSTYSFTAPETMTSGAFYIPSYVHAYADLESTHSNYLLGDWAGIPAGDFARFDTRFDAPVANEENTIPFNDTTSWTAYDAWSGMYEATRHLWSTLTISHTLNGDGTWNISDSYVLHYTITYAYAGANPGSVSLSQSGTLSYSFTSSGDEDSSVYLLTENRSDAYSWGHHASSGGESTQRTESGSQSYTFTASGNSTNDSSSGITTHEQRKFDAKSTSLIAESITADDGNGHSYSASWNSQKNDALVLGFKINSKDGALDESVDYSFQSKLTTNASPELINLLESDLSKRTLEVELASGETLPIGEWTVDGVRTETTKNSSKLELSWNTGNLNWDITSAKGRETFSIDVALSHAANYSESSVSPITNGTESVTINSDIEGDTDRTTTTIKDWDFNGSKDEITTSYEESYEQSAKIHFDRLIDKETAYNFEYTRSTTSDIASLIDDSTIEGHFDSINVTKTYRDGTTEGSFVHEDTFKVGGSVSEENTAEDSLTSPSSTHSSREKMKIDSILWELRDLRGGSETDTSGTTDDWTSDSTVTSKDYTFSTTTGYQISGKESSAPHNLTTYSSSAKQTSTGVGKFNLSLNKYDTDDGVVIHPAILIGTVSIPVNHDERSASVSGLFGWTTQFDTTFRAKDRSQTGFISTLSGSNSYSDGGSGMFQSSINESIENDDESTHAGSAESKSNHQGETDVKSQSSASTAGAYAPSPGITTIITNTSSSSSQAHTKYDGSSNGSAKITGYDYTASYDEATHQKTTGSYTNTKHESYSTVDLSNAITNGSPNASTGGSTLVISASDVRKTSSTTYSQKDEGSFSSTSDFTSSESWDSSSYHHKEAELTEISSTSGEIEESSTSSSSESGSIVSGKVVTKLNNSATASNSRKGTYSRKSDENTIWINDVLDESSSTVNDSSEGNSIFSSSESADTDVSDTGTADTTRTSHVTTNATVTGTGTDEDSSDTEDTYSSTKGTSHYQHTDYSTTKNGTRTIAAKTKTNVDYFFYDYKSSADDQTIDDVTKWSGSSYNNETNSSSDFEDTTSGWSINDNEVLSSHDETSESETGTFTVSLEMKQWAGENIEHTDQAKEPWSKAGRKKTTSYKDSNSETQRNGSGTFSSLDTSKTDFAAGIKSVVLEHSRKENESGTITRKDSRENNDDSKERQSETLLRTEKSKATFDFTSNGTYESSLEEASRDDNDVITSSNKTDESEEGTTTTKRFGMNSTIENMRSSTYDSIKQYDETVTNSETDDDEGTYKTRDKTEHTIFADGSKYDYVYAKSKIEKEGTTERTTDSNSQSQELTVPFSETEWDAALEWIVNEDHSTLHTFESGTVKTKSNAESTTINGVKSGVFSDESTTNLTTVDYENTVTHFYKRANTSLPLNGESEEESEGDSENQSESESGSKTKDELKLSFEDSISIPEAPTPTPAEPTLKKWWKSLTGEHHKSSGTRTERWKRDEVMVDDESTVDEEYHENETGSGTRTSYSKNSSKANGYQVQVMENQDVHIHTTAESSENEDSKAPFTTSMTFDRVEHDKKMVSENRTES